MTLSPYHTGDYALLDTKGTPGLKWKRQAGDLLSWGHIWRWLAITFIICAVILPMSAEGSNLVHDTIFIQDPLKDNLVTKFSSMSWCSIKNVIIINPTPNIYSVLLLQQRTFKQGIGNIYMGGMDIASRSYEGMNWLLGRIREIKITLDFLFEGIPINIHHQFFSWCSAGILQNSTNSPIILGALNIYKINPNCRKFLSKDKGPLTNNHIFFSQSDGICHVLGMLLEVCHKVHVNKAIAIVAKAITVSLLVSIQSATK